MKKFILYNENYHPIQAGNIQYFAQQWQKFIIIAALFYCPNFLAPEDTPSQRGFKIIINDPYFFGKVLAIDKGIRDDKEKAKIYRDIKV